MLVRDVLTVLVRSDPAKILGDSPDRALDYDPVARRVVRRLLRHDATSLDACVVVVAEEIDRVLALYCDSDEAEAAASPIWDRWEEILAIDHVLARMRESA